MVRKIVYVLLLILAVVLQETWIPLWAVAGATPDLLILFVVFTGLISGPMAGLLAGAGVGLLLDLLSGKYIGLSVLSMAAAGIATPLVCTHFYYKQKYIVPMVSVLFATVVEGFLYCLFSKFTSLSLPIFSTLFHFFLPRALYNMVLTPLLYWWAYRFFVEKNPMRF